MKRRKLIATLLAFTLVAGSALTVHAEEGESTGNITVSGNGTVDYVNTTIYKVTLPTNVALDLTIDPQGLAGLTNGSSATLDDLSVNAGKITSNSKPAVINESSVPMKVSVTMKITGDASVSGSDTGIHDDEVNNVYLYAVPSKSDVTDAAAATYTPADTTKFTLTKNSSTASFYIPAAAYQFTNTDDVIKYVRDTAQDPHGIALSFAGSVNKNADWSEYVDGTKTIGLSATFSFCVPGEDDAESNDPDAKFFIGFEEGEAEAEEPEEPEGPSITAGATPVDGQAWDYEATFNKGTALTLNVANATVTGYGWGTATDATTSTATSITSNSSSVTIGSGMWAAAATNSVRYIEIKLQDAESILVKVTVK